MALKNLFEDSKDIILKKPCWHTIIHLACSMTTRAVCFPLKMSWIRFVPDRKRNSKKTNYWTGSTSLTVSVNWKVRNITKHLLVFQYNFCFLENISHVPFSFIFLFSFPKPTSCISVFCSLLLLAYPKSKNFSLKKKYQMAISLLLLLIKLKVQKYE